MTTARWEVFKRAADIIAKHGHFKGTYHGDNGESCVLGALTDALGKPWTAEDKWFPFVRDVEATAGTDYIVAWNDAPERTAGEVIAALDAAAVVAMQEAGLEPEDVLS